MSSKVRKERKERKYVSNEVEDILISFNIDDTEEK